VSDFLLTAEELRLRQARRRRWIIGAISSLLLIVTVLVLARPASHAIKRWQSRRHAEKAFALIEKEEWNEAQKETTAAYQLASDEPEAIRAVARFLSRMRQPQALEFWDKLAEHHPLAPNDLRDEAALALSLGETGRAHKAVGQLLAHDGRDATARDWLLAAQLAAQSDSPNDAAAALQKIFSGKASAHEQWQAAVLQITLARSGSEDDQKLQLQAWNRIEQLAKGKDQAGLDALVLLAQRELSQKAEQTKTQTPISQSAGTADNSTSAASPSPITNNEEPITADALAAAIETHPLAKAPQKLLSVDLRIHTAPGDKEKLIQTAVDHWKNADTDSLVALATWLNGKGEFQRQLDTIPVNRSLQTRELFLQHVDALGALGRWEEIRELLEGERFPLDPVIGHMYLARCYAQLGQEVASQNSWERALEKTSGDPAKLMTMADYAEKNGAKKIAERACDTALASAPKLRAAWQMKLRLAQSERATTKIHAALVGMLKIWPNDTAMQNDEAYTRLLLAGAGKPEMLKTEALKSNDGAGGTMAAGTGGTTALSSEADDSSRKPEVSDQKLEDRNSPSPSARSLPAAAGPPSCNPPITNNSQPLTPAQLNTIEALAQDLVKREPASLPHRTLLALARLKQDRPSAAFEVYADLRIPPNAATPSAVAVHAAVLGASGREEDAKTEAGAVNWDHLLPEEQALIDKLR